MDEARYVANADAVLRASAKPTSKGLKLLLGARLNVTPTADANGFHSATTMSGANGFVHENDVSKEQQLKIFYIDVGQGDAALIEVEGLVMVIDGGPDDSLFSFLKKRCDAVQEADIATGDTTPDPLEINIMVLTHPDKDHYQGLTKVLESDRFRIGTLFHNGLVRYGEPADKDLDLGDVTEHAGARPTITADLDDIASAQALLDSDALLTENNNLNTFGRFLFAAVGAHTAGRLKEMRALNRASTAGAPPTLEVGAAPVQVEVLAPIAASPAGAAQLELPTFFDPKKVTATNPMPAPSDSHTINGNSIVLRLVHERNTFLFGGDLNQPSQIYLREEYGDLRPNFRSDVNKACHHGSSDFDIEYLEAVKAKATVFSSGDNGNHDHPLPDALGAAARSGSGRFPLIFSTELAREPGDEVMRGHINARSNGRALVMAQQKERAGSDPWHQFDVPYRGPFT